jgi:HEAT repeat protein
MLTQRERGLLTPWSNYGRVTSLLVLVFVGATLLGTGPLPAQEQAGQEKTKSGADAGKSADEVLDAIRREIGSLQQAGNWRGLVAKLKDRRPAVRRQAAFALQRVAPDVKRDAELKQLLPPLVAATLHDSDADVHMHARFALRDVLSRVEDEPTLISVAQSLLTGLSRKNPQVRAHCVHDLSGVVSKVKNEAALVRMMPVLTAATLKAESMEAPDFAGFALRIVFRKTNNERALIPVMRSWLVALNHKDASMRAYFAHALYENVGKIEDKKVLVQTVKPLTAAALQVKDSRNGALEAPDLAYMALKQVLDKVDDQAALKSIVTPMAEALKSAEVKRRRYAAHAVMLFGHKVEDKAALWPLVQPLVAAHFHDPDEAARRSAGLALERTFGRMTEPNEVPRKGEEHR